MELKMKILFMCIMMAELGMAAQQSNSCVLEVQPENGEAVVFGKEYKVPDLKIQVLDKVSGRLLTPKAIDVFYIWDWFEYPATDHPFGTWDQSSEIIHCADYQNGDIIIPAYTVKPRGWYNGVYARLPWPKKPQFKHLEINVYLPQCTVPRIKIEPGELKQYQRNQAVWRVSCKEIVEVLFLKD